MNEAELLVRNCTEFIQRFSITPCLCDNISIEIYGFWWDSKFKFNQQPCIIQDRLNKL